MIQKHTDHLFYAHQFSLDSLATPEIKEESFARYFPYGKLELKQWYFDGILIRHSKSNFNDHYLFENKNDLDMVSLDFNLKGTYEIHHLSQTYRVNHRQHNIIYTPHVHNTFYNNELIGETFKILILPKVFLRIVKDSNDTLKKFADKIMDAKPSVIALVSPSLHVDLYRCIHEIIHCRYHGWMKKVFVLSKCMEILVMQAEAFDRAENTTVIKSRKKEKDEIFSARDYLIENIDNPPSLTELSKIVGVNEYKLKRGFKETFHTTVFGYLSDRRLEKARSELLENTKNISEIAYDLGYSSPQHFSAAFKKKFGVPPKMVKSLIH